MHAVNQEYYFLNKSMPRESLRYVLVKGLKKRMDDEGRVSSKHIISLLVLQKLTRKYITGAISSITPTYLGKNVDCKAT